jgi:hypothetical protein
MGTGSSFVSEPIEPDVDTMDPARIARGEPDAPRAFRWRGTRYEVARVARTWRSVKVDRGERYVDRHWFEVVTSGGETMRLYCLRRERAGGRWFLFSVEPLHQG